MPSAALSRKTWVKGLISLLSFYIQGEHKKVSPTTLVDISAMRGDFCMKVYRTVKQSNVHFITKFGWNCWKVTNLCYFNQDNPPPFLSVRTSWRTTESERVHWEDCSGPQALQIWTHWTVTSGAPCWKSTINSSRSIRQLMSWKSLCRPFGKRCLRTRQIKVVAIFSKCLTAWLCVHLQRA